MSLTPKQAAEEMLRRSRARTSLIDFTRYTFPQYRPSDHHFQIAEGLERVARGECKRLMITMPPRHGKSELASRRFPSWVLGDDPNKNLISASYNSDLASDFGREVRNIVNSQQFSNVFPDVALAKDSAAANRWHTNGRGGYVAAGIGTAVTGRGAHIFTIDDPVKDRQEAESETNQKRAYDWYTSTAYTRLESTLDEELTDEDLFWDVGASLAEGLITPFEGAIILIQTRWHENDLSGRLLVDMENGADQWDLLNLPAISDSGKALWSSKYPLSRLRDIEKAIGGRDFSALYQQDPTPDDGNYYKRDWFKRYHPADLPETLNKYATSDLAATEDGDFTEHTVFGLDANDDSYILENWHGQTSTDVWCEQLLRLHKEHEFLAWFPEGGSIFKAVEPFLQKMMQERRQYINIEKINPIHNKVISSRSFQGRASQGKIYIPHGPDGDRMIEQLLKFPQGKYDDFNDTCSLWGRALDETYKANLPTLKESGKVSRWDKAFDDDNDASNWKTI